MLGLADSTVRVCSLSEKVKLKMIKQLNELELLDKESDDVLNLMFDESSGAEHRTRKRNKLNHLTIVFLKAFIILK